MTTFFQHLGDGTTSVDGFNGFDTLDADWSAATGDVHTAISANGVQVGGLPDDIQFFNYGDIVGPPSDGALHFANIDILDLTTGAGADQLYVDNSALQVNWDGGAGDDAFVAAYADSHGPTVNMTITEGPGHVYYTASGGVIRNVEHISIATGVGSDTYNLMSLDGDFRFQDFGGVDTLTENLTASTHAISTVFAYGAPGAVTDRVTGDSQPFADIEHLSVATGSGDDDFAFTYQETPDQTFAFDGGGGQNRFTGDFSGYASDLTFTLDAAPAAISTLPMSIYESWLTASLTNIQSVDLTSGPGNDALTGGGGGDTFTGGAGNDTLDGGGGYDTAVFGGIASDYAVTTDPSGVTTVTDLRAGSPDGTDTLRHMDLLKFADLSVAPPPPDPVNTVVSPDPVTMLCRAPSPVVSMVSAAVIPAR